MVSGNQCKVIHECTGVHASVGSVQELTTGPENAQGTASTLLCSLKQLYVGLLAGGTSFEDCCRWGGVWIRNMVN